MTLLPILRKGDKVGVWTASDPVIGTDAEQWVHRGRNALEKMGFPVVFGKSLTARTDYTAGSADCRWRDFSDFIQNPQIKLILTAMGGENAHQILPLMDFELVTRYPKIIMGYSDPTVFLNPIVTLSKVPTFYGYHLASFDPQWRWFGGYDRDCFEQMFIKAVSPFEVPPAGPRECWREGVGEGPLIGGCLTDLIKLLATPWEPLWDSSILILETMGQNLQKIDVHITHLLQTGVFERISGLVLGKFYDCGESSKNKKTLKEVVMNILSDFQFPILKTEDFGHFSHICPLPLGVKCQLSATTKSLRILDPIFKKSQ